MRKALALVALAAACDGGSGVLPTADAPVDDMVEEIMPDARERIDGIWRDTYHTTQGDKIVSACNAAAAPAAVRVDAVTAVQEAFAGTCAADGTFTINAPNSASGYYLRVQGTLFETTRQSGIDLSGERLGRNDIAGITGVSLQLSVNNMQSYTAGDLLVAWSANLGYRQVLTFSSGGPSSGATTLSGVAAWGSYKVDTAASDKLQIMQLGKHTTASSLEYLSLDRAYTAPSFTMSNNAQQALAGSFVTPDQSSLTLDVDVASFNQFTSAAPAISSTSLQGTAYAAISTDVIESPSLFQFAQPTDSVTSLGFGTVTLGDPFPAAWNRYVRLQAKYTVPYTYGSASGDLAVLQTRVMTKAVAEAGTVSATLGPVTSIQFDGADALTATDISPVPMLSWSAPALGTPTDYEVQVYEAKSSGGTTLTFSSVLKLVTKSTSLRIPAGYLLGARQYVFLIRARAREGVDVYETPLRAGAQWSMADALTALVTTGS